MGHDKLDKADKTCDHGISVFSTSEAKYGTSSFASVSQRLQDVTLGTGKFFNECDTEAGCCVDEWLFGQGFNAGDIAEDGVTDYNMSWNDPETCQSAETQLYGGEDYDSFTFPEFGDFTSPSQDTNATGMAMSLEMFKGTLQGTPTSRSSFDLLDLPTISSQLGDFDQSALENMADFISHGPKSEAPSSESTSTDMYQRKFVCDMTSCGKSYGRSYDLRRHRRTHSSIRAHSCSYTTCHKSGQNGFVRRDHLRQHMRQVHGA